jgi:hypothetical protein
MTTTTTLRIFLTISFEGGTKATRTTMAKRG